ncbi:hypothetical protein [Cyclobacterium amurskyense]|uniref:Uncharacterized protein n=1 Tax=Cyclobacterium amurskyense TaxID=320787 RepID=A0A0H4P8M2_9BACT|nr:hypothetical protein [Cyclobacterium amurskyense]AKP50836.1 hypothetical protein CA2015_1394 [Cyclobacterium amurskyense]
MKQDLNKVLRYIEENIRVTDQTTIEYLDPKGHIERLGSRQNQVIYGRRGSGKSLLLKSLKLNNESKFCITINLDDFKDISFPDSIIQVLRIIIKQLSKRVDKEYKWYQLNRWKKAIKIQRDLSKYLKTLNERLNNPDLYEEASRTKTGSKLSGEAKSGYAGSEAKVGTELSEEQEFSKTIKINKLNILRNELTDFKELIERTTEFINNDIFLILDDFYFIRKSDQPYFADFFHRISKNTRLYLKIATIKHRSSLYIQGETYIGMEIRHDGQSLNLDYSLENFNAMVSFMKDLLNYVNKKVDVDLNYDKLFTPNAFRFLCLSSGGVPRDFFASFLSIGNKIINGQQSITKPMVIETSIEDLPYKLEAFKTDSQEEKEILEHYLQYIQNIIITEKRWNSFLVSNTDITKYPQINQAIKELVDLRLLHLANSNTSCAPSDGIRYSSYLVDIGLFPNSNPRKFNQVEPGQKDEKGREDKLRSAPKINLENFKDFIEGKKLKKNLKVTD